MQTCLPKGFFPGQLTLSANLTGLREAPEVGEAWLQSEFLRMLVGETDLSQWTELESRQALLSVHGS